MSSDGHAGVMRIGWLLAVLCSVVAACGGSAQPAATEGTQTGTVSADEHAELKKQLDELVARLTADDAQSVHAKLGFKENLEYTAIIRNGAGALAQASQALQASDGASPQSRALLLKRARAALTLAAQYTAKADETRAKMDSGPTTVAQGGQGTGSGATSTSGSTSSADDAKAEMARVDTVCATVAGCESACNQSDQSACARLGFKYEDGDGVPRDYAKGAALIRTACNAGSKYACAIIASLQDRANDCADEATCTELCNREIFKACDKLAAEYLAGRGVQKNAMRAQQLYKKACDGGDGAGCNGLGFMYWRGEGVARDRTAAQGFIQKSCDVHFDVGCQNLIGVKCVNDAKAASQRRPAQDAKCEAAKRSPQNLVSDPRKRYEAFETPDVNKLDICYEAMNKEGCFQVNLLQQNTTIYCCP